MDNMSYKQKRKRPPSSSPGSPRRSLPNGIEDIGQFEKDPKKYRYFIERGLKVLLISDKKPDRRSQTINTTSTSQPLELQSISLDYHQHGIDEWEEQDHSNNEDAEKNQNFKKYRQRSKSDSKKVEQLKDACSSYCDLNSLDSKYAKVSPYNLHKDRTSESQNRAHSQDFDNETNDNMQTAAVNLLVATGYVDEPFGYNGIAHLHEHLLTLTLPNHLGEMVFMNKVQEFGGQNTNITERTCTHHSFEVPHQHLESALSIFIQLLKKRPFPLETIITETKVLDHEFRPNKNVKGMIRDHIISHMAKKCHPLSNFTWGNLQSLGPPIEVQFDKNEVKKYYETLKAELEKFTEAHYVRGNMYVVFQAPMNLDEMQKLAIEAFATIPEGMPPHIPQDPEPFNTDRFQAKKYRVRITHSQEVLYLTWALSIEDWQSYKTKPIAYLASIIRSNQPRGLVDYLKRQRWIYKLDSGIQFDNRSRFGCLFIIKMKLTEEGSKNETKLIASVLEFLRLLSTTTISAHECIWNEMRNYRRVWLEQSMAFLEPFKNVEKMVKALRWHSAEHPQHIIPAYTQFLEFDAKVIFSVLGKLLQVDKMNLMLLSNKFFQGNEVHNIYWDTHYKLQFAFRGFEGSELAMWKDVVSKTKVSLDKFQFPELNIFTTNIYYLTPERRKILQKEIKERHKRDGEGKTSTTFNADKKVRSDLCTKFIDTTYPWSTFDLEIVSKVDSQTPRRQALILIIRYSWNYELRAVFGMGKQAGLNSTLFTTSYQGLGIHVEGFDKMAMFLMLKIIQFIKLKIKEVNGESSCRGDIDVTCHFDFAKEFYLKLFHDMYLGPEPFARYILELLKRNKQIPHFEILNELHSLKREEFRNFYYEFLSSLEFEIFANGAICKSEFDCLVKELQSIPVKSLESWQHNPHVQGQLIKLDKNTQVVWRHFNLNPMDSTTFYLSYYQIGSKPEPLIPGLVKIIFKYFFVHIRYKWEMAYNIGVDLEVSEGMEGERVQGVKFHLRVFCEKFSVNEINQAMNEFIECFYKQLKDITKGTFRKWQRTYFKTVKGKFSLQDLISKFDSYFRPSGIHYARATVIVEGRKSIREDFMNHVRHRQNKPIKANQQQLPINPSAHEKPLKISPITSPTLSRTSSSFSSLHKIEYINDMNEFQKYADYFRRMPTENE